MMVKFPAILVVINKDRLSEVFESLNFQNVQLAAIVMDVADNGVLASGNIRVPLLPFQAISGLLKNKTQFMWLIGGAKSQDELDTVRKLREFLIDEGVPKDNIVNITGLSNINRAWLGNLKFAATHSIKFFATGMSFVEFGLDLDILLTRGGINLAESNQDLQHSYLIAKYIFERQQSIRFMLIGLAPHSFRVDNQNSFSECVGNLKYMLALNRAPESHHDKVLQVLLGEKMRRSYFEITDADSDPNFIRARAIDGMTLSPNKLADWKSILDNLTPEFRAESIEKNLAAFEDCIKLCLEHGAKPIVIVLPVSPIILRHYPKELLMNFRQTLRLFQKAYDFNVIDLFELPLGYDCFRDHSHLNMRGAALTGLVLNSKLHDGNILQSVELVRDKYDRFYQLSMLEHKDDYNAMMDRVLSASAENIRRKEKIKVGFVGYDASMWCGDLLYQMFARNERYEATMFLCLRRDQFNEPTVIKDFHHGIEQFQARGVNVVGISEDDAEIPKQDVLILLTPYLSVLPKAFQLNAISAETLITYIPYGFQVSSNFPNFNESIMPLCWKIFWETEHSVNLYEKGCRMGMPRGCYSGYPKMDVFFGDTLPEFNWKKAVPNPIKIIYAPHWSIDSGVKFATFQHNFEFFYEYAKNHPETSWVFKPHPNLLFSAVQTKVFQSVEAFEQYLQHWNELPNAKVETGAYYYDIFKSSDGMILDSGSFIAEYQYTHKPMCFLTRDTQQLSNLAIDLMKGIYRIDGRDHKGIASFIENVLVKKIDPLADIRQQMFNKHLNYKKVNGVLASEYIFNAIDRELGGDRNG